MNIQTISDAIAAKTTELDTVLAKSEPTMDDVATAKTLNTEIEGMQNQLTEVKSFESIKAANAARVAGNATPVNRLPQTPTIKVGETSAKANMTDAEYKATVTGLFVGGLTSEAARAKYQEITGVDYKTHTQGNDATGGIFVPNVVSSYIISLKESYGVFRRVSRVEPMTSESTTIWRDGDDVIAYWGSELANYVESDMSWDAVTLNVKKLTAFSRLSEELIMNSTQNLGIRFANSVARQFARREDQAGFNGDGTSTFGGILGLDGKFKKLVVDGGGTWTTDANKQNAAGVQLTTAASANTYAEVVIGDFLAGKAKLPEYARGGASWYINRVVHGATMERLAYATGGATAAELAGSFGERFLGYPVTFVDVMPSVEANSQIFAYFGDLSLATTFGDRQQVSIKQDASIGFVNDTVAVKATQYVDINVHDIGNYNATAANRVAGPVIAFSLQNA
jgi:HK97 family phage major capsid protein